MNVDNSKEWHWFKGGVLVSILSVVTYIIFEALNDRNYPFGITGWISDMQVRSLALRKCFSGLV